MSTTRPVYSIADKAPEFPCELLQVISGLGRTSDRWIVCGRHPDEFGGPLAGVSYTRWRPLLTPRPQQPGQEGAIQKACNDVRARMNKIPYDSPERLELLEAGMKAIYGGVENWRELHAADMAKFWPPSPTAEDPYLTGNPATDILVMALESIAGEQMAPGNNCDAVAIAALEKFRRAKEATAGMSGGEQALDRLESNHRAALREWQTELKNASDLREALQRAEKERDRANKKWDELLGRLDAREAQLTHSEEVRKRLAGALDRLESVIRAAGVANLMNGVQLGQISWFHKASDAMVDAKSALAASDALDKEAPRDKVVTLLNGDPVTTKARWNGPELIEFWVPGCPTLSLEERAHVGKQLKEGRV